MGQRGVHHTALMRDDVGHVDAAPQRGGQDAPGAGSDDDERLVHPPIQPFLHGRKSPGHPGRAEHTATTEDDADARPLPDAPSRGLVEREKAIRRGSTTGVLPGAVTSQTQSVVRSGPIC